MSKVIRENRQWVFAVNHISDRFLYTTGLSLSLMKQVTLTAECFPGCFLLLFIICSYIILWTYFISGFGTEKIYYVCVRFSFSNNARVLGAYALINQ